MGVRALHSELLVNKLKELGLGVKTKAIEIEEVSIDNDWFFSL